MHLSGAATFLRLSDLSDLLERIPADREVHVRFEHLETLDHSILELLQTWAHQRKARGSTVVIDWKALERRYRASQIEELSLQKPSENHVDSLPSAP